MTQTSLAFLTPVQAARVLEVESLWAELTNPAQNENGWLPAFSSHAIKTTVREILKMPNLEINEIFYGLWALLEHTQTPLTRDMADFIKEFLINVTINYRSLKKRHYWSEADLSWVVRALKQKGTPAQFYLALRILSDDQLIACKEEMFTSLKDNTAFFHYVLMHPAYRTPDVLPYGVYKIEPIEVPTGIADAVQYTRWTGAELSTIISEDSEETLMKRSALLKPNTPAPSNWQELVKACLGLIDDGYV